MKLVFSDRAFAAILAETTEKIKTETGGLFLGAYEDGIWYVIEAIDPGPKSVFEVAYFEYDQQYTQHLINKVSNLYDAKLALVGLWHRHPGSFDKFSSTDDETNAKYATLNSDGAVSALVNIDPDFRLTVYHVGRSQKYSPIAYEVGNHRIPEHLLKLKKPDWFAAHIQKLGTPHENCSDTLYHRSVSLASFMQLIVPHLKKIDYTSIPHADSNAADPDCIKETIINELAEDIYFLSDECKMEFLVQPNDMHICLIQDAIDKQTKLCFAFSEQLDCVFFSYEDACYKYQANHFQIAFKEAAEARAEATTVSKPASLFRSIFKIVEADEKEVE